MNGFRKQFQFRTFTSLVSLWSFCALLFSGALLYIKPSGSLADQINWSFLWIDKIGWEAMHTIFSMTFAAFIFLHIYFNWRPLITYITSKIFNGFSYRKELAISIIFITLLLIGAITRVQPLWKIIELRSYLKYEWRAIAEPEEPEIENDQPY